jgi:hypothetical protein
MKEAERKGSGRAGGPRCTTLLIVRVAWLFARGITFMRQIDKKYEAER